MGGLPGLLFIAGVVYAFTFRFGRWSVRGPFRRVGSMLGCDNGRTCHVLKGRIGARRLVLKVLRYGGGRIGSVFRRFNVGASMLHSALCSSRRRTVSGVSTRRVTRARRKQTLGCSGRADRIVDRTVVRTHLYRKGTTLMRPRRLLLTVLGGSRYSPTGLLVARNLACGGLFSCVGNVGLSVSGGLGGLGRRMRGCGHGRVSKSSRRRTMSRGPRARATPRLRRRSTRNSVGVVSLQSGRRLPRGLRRTSASALPSNTTSTRSGRKSLLSPRRRPLSFDRGRGSNGKGRNNGGNGGTHGMINTGPAGSGAPCLSGFDCSLAGTTGSNDLSPMMKESGRVAHLVRVLKEEGGGGPMLVNRPNINGDTVMRKLTRVVTGNSRDSLFFGGQMLDLSVANVITNAGCENRFRRHVGNIVGRLRGGPGVVIFVSRVRALVNTNNTRKDVSTTGVVGPTLTHNFVRYVKTAALGRCHGDVRGSNTLRHEFRGVVMRPAATRRALRVLRGVGRGCRRRRGIDCASRTLGTYMGLTSECVRSHSFPSGTVSIVSRTNTRVRVGDTAIPSRLVRTRGGLGTAVTGGRTTITDRGFRVTTALESCRAGRRHSVRVVHGR